MKPIPADGLAAAVSLAALFLLSEACSKKPDTQSLDSAGIGYTVVQTLREMEITEEEVLEVVKAKQSGVSDAGCLELVKQARARGGPFAAGDEVQTLRDFDFTEQEVLEFARVGQLGLWVGEVKGLRLGNVGKPLILELTRQRAMRKPILSGVSIFRLRDAGYSEGQIQDFVREGLTDEGAKFLLGEKPKPSTKFRRLR